MQHLAEPHLVVERAYGLLDRRQVVPHVQPEQVDVVRPEPPQALLERPHQALAMVSARVRIVAIERQRVLRRDHEPVSIARDELADVPLARAVGVVGGSVDEVAAGLDEAVEDRTALLEIRAPAPVRPERHRSERELGDAKAAAAEDLESEWAECRLHGSIYIEYV